MQRPLAHFWGLGRRKNQIFKTEVDRVGKEGDKFQVNTEYTEKISKSC